MTLYFTLLTNVVHKTEQELIDYKICQRLHMQEKDFPSFDELFWKLDEDHPRFQPFSPPREHSPMQSPKFFRPEQFSDDESYYFCQDEIEPESDPDRDPRVYALYLSPDEGSDKKAFQDESASDTPSASRFVWSKLTN